MADTITRQAVRWRQHKCERTHRTARAWITCAIGTRRILWAHGEGRWATISWCGAWNDVSVRLHPTLADAQTAIRIIDNSACGGRCHRKHSLVEIVR